MTGEEQDLSEKYLAHRNVIGDEGDYPDFESWYQAVRYAQGPSAPRTPCRRPRNCATRTSWTPPGSSTGCRRIQYPSSDNNR